MTAWIRPTPSGCCSSSAGTHGPPKPTCSWFPEALGFWYCGVGGYFASILVVPTRLCFLNLPTFRVFNTTKFENDTALTDMMG
jgi:hypothetical protein